MHKYSFLLLSGGVGSRSDLTYPKQFYMLNGHPMVAYSLIAAIQVEQIDEIILNYPPGFKEQTETIAHDYASSKKVKLVECGQTRHDSTRILYGVASNEHVIIHEAARPAITPSRIQDLIDNPRDNVSYCESIPFSMCHVDHDSGRLISRVDRETTMNIQLPQKFVKSHLASAHETALAEGKIYTEDAMLVAEVGGHAVYFQEGWRTNFKITNRDDFKIAEVVMRELHTQ